MTIDTPPRAALWDMDGTLLDSAEYHWLAWRDSMLDLGYPLTYEEFVATFGQRNDAILRGWISQEITDIEIARISDVKEARYRTLVREHGIVLLPGVRVWLERLQAAGWRRRSPLRHPRECRRRWSRFWVSARSLARWWRPRMCSAASPTRRCS